MKTNQMWNLAVAAALCCTPALAQAPAGGGGQAPGGSGMGQSGGQPNAGAPNSMDNPSMQQQQGGSGMNGGHSADKMFVHKALEGSMAEVQMGQVALEKSNDPQVKQFAQKMVDDHGKMLDEMKPVAQQMGVKVPDGPSKAQMKTMDKMKGLSGDAFDQAYVNDMVKDHKQDDKEFKQELQTTQNPQLKQLVTEGDQTIEGHLQMIQQIAQSKGTMKAKM